MRDQKQKALDRDRHQQDPTKNQQKQDFNEKLRNVSTNSSNRQPSPLQQMLELQKEHENFFNNKHSQQFD